ncbi:MAG: LysM peptidoglycan-binding domain-containing protein [Anaerolineae bacterium]|nr:LysM peptidoglycan-binding domain-containing protein [Anaerolineae bacterium]MDQ7036740.1 LysM peptidoglycan-binding domain-containing protein [Anaerolineae bacterium]
MKNYRLLVLILLAIFSFSVLPAFAQDSSTHTVQSGENLFRIALRYGIDINELAAANGISDPTHIFVGQELSIPGLSAPNAGDVVENPLVAAAPVIHTVQRGEYLSQIAESYNVSVEQILAANNIASPDTVYPGQELQIWTDSISEVQQPVETAAPEANETITEIIPTPNTQDSVTHTVAPGEYLSLIARNYGVPWTTIAEANGITDPNHVYAGMQLTIPGGDASAAPVSTFASIPTIAENLVDPGAHWGVGRELVVDLSTQMAYAYQDGALQYSAIVSTGLPATPTVQGEYAIWHRTPSQTMTGPGYNLPNVQWVMYFYQGYGFHGTYWHNNFGTPMSHGCVNMTNADALWFYNFASLGTNVWVQT